MSMTKTTSRVPYGPRNPAPPCAAGDTACVRDGAVDVEPALRNQAFELSSSSLSSEEDNSDNPEPRRSGRVKRPTRDTVFQA
jgi:hypothetical protein